LTDTAPQYVLSHDDVRPYGLKQLLLGKRFAGLLGQAQQDLHYFWFEANGPAFGRHAVEGRIDDPASHFETLLHEVPRARYPAGSIRLTGPPSRKFPSISRSPYDFGGAHTITCSRRK